MSDGRLAETKVIEKAVRLLDHGKTDSEIRAILSDEFDNIDANFNDLIKAAHDRFIEDVHAREDDLRKTAFEAVDRRIEVEQERDRLKGEIAVARWESVHGRRLTGTNKVFSG